MDVSEHLDALRQEGPRLADAAERHGLGVAIPTCPDWTMADLVRHTGGVHRWATAHVAGALTAPIATMEEVVGPWPGDTDLTAWFREGHALLVDALAGADPAVECFSFLPAPTPLAFWARRQAHETGIHRVDAEGPGGAAAITPFAPAVAADGIDELVIGFAARPGGRLRADEPKVMHIHAADGGVEHDWIVTITPDGPKPARGSGDEADFATACTVTGAASDLFLLLWNRRGRDGIDVEGDAALLDDWRDAIRIRWR